MCLLLIAAAASSTTWWSAWLDGVAFDLAALPTDIQREIVLTYLDSTTRLCLALTCLKFYKSFFEARLARFGLMLEVLAARPRRTIACLTSPRRSTTRSPSRLSKSLTLVRLEWTLRS